MTYLGKWYIFSKLAAEHDLRLSIMWWEFIENNTENAKVLSKNQQVSTFHSKIDEIESQIDLIWYQKHALFFFTIINPAQS